jgi:hypothetical protein
MPSNNEVQIGCGTGVGVKAGVHERETVRGLVTYNVPLHEFEPTFTPFINPELGANMALDFTFGGTPAEIHDGEDNTYWTGSEISGVKVTFDSTDQANSGSQSVKIDNPAVNDTWEFLKASTINLSSYVAITFAIYVEKDWVSGDEVQIYGWDSSGGLEVGNRVNIEDYIDELDYDVWQNGVIPLSDLGLTSSTIDAIRFQLVAKSGKAPKFYLDDIQFEQTGTPGCYEVYPPPGKVLYVDTLRWAYTDALDTTLASNSMYNLSYNKLLGLSKLANGISYQQVIKKKVVVGVKVRQLADHMKTNTPIESVICDGTNTLMILTTQLHAPVLLRSDQEDKLVITLSDDFSPLIGMQVAIAGRTRPL